MSAIECSDKSNLIYVGGNDGSIFLIQHGDVFGLNDSDIDKLAKNNNEYAEMIEDVEDKNIKFY